MRTVFADTGYWIAMSNPRDQWYENAKSATARLGSVRIVTSQMVLVEFLKLYGWDAANNYYVKRPCQSLGTSLRILVWR